jgi:capsular exopolysaccharide synthesis family protein
MTEHKVASAIAVSSGGQADVASIQATSRTPAVAAALANTYAQTYIAFRRDADRATIASAEQPLQQQLSSLPRSQRSGALGQSLEQRLSQLSVLSSLQTGNAELVQPAPVPSSPSSPKPVRNGAFGLFFGVLLGIALALIAETRDRRVRDPAELEQLFDRPVLAVLPQSEALASTDPTLLSAREPDRETFRMLWVSLRYFRLSRDIRSVLITSADRGDGKSTVAWGLAVTAASAGARTLLIEADLRNPTLARRFEAPAERGLSDVLVGDVQLSSAVVGLYLADGKDGSTGPRRLDVLFAGTRPPDPTDLLQSGQMAAFLRKVEADYDLVVIDTPPAAIVSDAIPLIATVRGVIIVGRLGTTLRHHAHRLRQQLHNLDAPTLGVVVNSVPDSGYGYADGYYTYGQVSPPAKQGNGRASVPQREPVVDSASATDVSRSGD